MVKGVGCDGFNAYLVRHASQAVRRKYYHAVVSMIRSHRYHPQYKVQGRYLYLVQGRGRRPIPLP